MGRPERTVLVEVEARPKRGFWRADRYWPSSREQAEVTESKLEILVKEPLLIVQVLEEEERKRKAPSRRKSSRKPKAESGPEEEPAPEPEAESKD